MTWTDEEFESRVTALDAVLDRHLGSPLKTVDPLDAEYVMMALWLPAAGVGAMNPRREREKLLKVQRLAGELTEAWSSLHPDVRAQMELLSASIYETTGKQGRRSSIYPHSLGLLSVVDGIVETALPLANEIIETAPTAGRRSLVHVAVVERLRHVWNERKGSAAPTSMTETGPFAEFMIDAFNALGLPGNPRAALDSWREFRARWPDGR